MHEGDIVDALDDPDEDLFLVWPATAESMHCFLALQTQWRVGAMGGVIGLDYAAAETVMRLMRVKDRRMMFDDLRAMEAAALPILNEAQP